MGTTTSPEAAITPDKKMDIKDMGEALGRWARGELSAEKFSEFALAYLDSPDWHRRSAAQAAEDLKRWKAGRERILELIEKARSEGYLIETRIEPLRGGHDSLIVEIEGCMTGFPSFYGPDVVEEGFEDLLGHAKLLRDERLAKG